MFFLCNYDNVIILNFNNVNGFNLHFLFSAPAVYQEPRTRIERRNLQVRCLESNVPSWRIDIAEQIRSISVDTHNFSGVLSHFDISRKLQLWMRFELELNVSVCEWREEVETEDVSIEETREARPITNRKELKDFLSENCLKNCHLYETHFFLPKLFFRH
jgi:hypothetical protein